MSGCSIRPRLEELNVNAFTSLAELMRLPASPCGRNRGHHQKYGDNLKELTKTEKIINTLRERKRLYSRIPSATTFALARSPHSPEDCKKDSRKFADAMVSARKEFNYDGLWAGLFQGVTSFMGGGLIDKHGKKSVSGNGTVRQPEDMKKLRPFHVDLCEALHHIMENIALLKKLEPAEPVLVIVDNPSMVAAALMDEENYYLT